MREAVVFPAILILVGLAVGCEPVTHQVRISSDPPGARIELNGDYIGDAPIDYFFRSPLAENVWPEDTEIVAYPAESGQFVQNKSFRHHTRLPRHILFIMNLAPPDTTQRIRIDQDVRVQGRVEADVYLK